MFCSLDKRRARDVSVRRNRVTAPPTGRTGTDAGNGNASGRFAAWARSLKFARIAAPLLACSILLFLPARTAQAQEARANQRVVPVAEVYDLEFINRFLEDQIIFPNDPEYTHAVFMDITEDGFGSNDILVLYPGREHFTLSPYLPEAMLNTLVSLNLETDYRINTVRDRTVLLASEAEGEGDPKKALAGAMLGSLLHYYPEGPMEVHLVQRGEDVHITFWNFDEDLWTFKPEATQCIHPGLQTGEELVIMLHKQPEILSHIDSEGCVIVENLTSAGSAVSRTCP